MQFKMVRPGVYRAQSLTGVYIWLVREGRKWMWYQGGYASYPAWEYGNGPFDTRKDALKDIRNWLG